MNFNLLAPQLQFYQLPHKYRAFVAGFGSGKSQCLIDMALLDAIQYPKATIGLFAPTYDLLSLITVPRLCARLDEFGIRYNHNKQRNTIACTGIGNFLFRSLDNPERIVGFELFSAYIDELDTLKHKHAEHAWNMVVARCRQNIDNLPNRVSCFTTPEGYRFVYDRWVTNKTDDYGMVQASTFSNPFLPSDYIQNLRNNYAPELFEAYVNGQFCNLTSGSVYKSYDVTLNDCNTTLDGNEEIHVGIDFNISNTSAAIMVKRGYEVHMIDEIVKAFDTQELCDILIKRYGNRRINVYPDAAGRQRRTSSKTTDHQILEQARFYVYVDGTNPRVMDRVNTMNAAFCNANGVRRLKINKALCPTASKNLIQQSYDDNGEPDKKSGVDHLNDAIGYVTCKLLPFSGDYVPLKTRFV